MKKSVCLFGLLLAGFVALAAQDVDIYPWMGLREVGIGSYSPDGKWILSYGGGIWEASTGRELKRPYSKTIVGWSPDMRRYAQGSGTIIRVRNWETDEIITTIRNVNAEKAVFSPDGKQIASITNDGINIKIYDAANGQEQITITGAGDGIRIFSYGVGGRTIVFTDYNNTVKIYDINNKRLLSSSPLQEYVAGISEYTFSKNGKYYIRDVYTETGGKRQGFVKIWDTETGKEIRILSGHNTFITALAYSPDDKRIISADRNNVMKIWEAGTGRELKTIKTDNYIYRLIFSPDGKQIVYNEGSSGKITKLDAETYRELLTIKSLPSISSVTYTINEKRLIVQKGNNISLWDTENIRRLWTIQEDVSSDRELWFSPTKQLFAKAAKSTDTKQGANNISIYDTNTGRLIRTWPNLRNINTSTIIWNLNGKEITTFSYVFFVGNACLFDVWNVESGQKIQAVNHVPKPISDKTQSGTMGNYLNHDATRIAYAFEDSLQIWDTRSTSKLLTVSGSFNGAMWSPNGSRIITSSSDGTVKVWDAQSGKEISSSIKHVDLRTMAYSPDGRQIATGGRNEWVAAWNAENGSKLWEKKVYGTVNSVTYTPDGKRIIAITGNDSVIILDAANGNNLVSVPGISASISADGKWLTTGSRDGAVCVYSAETFIEKARFIAYDDGEWLALTPEGYYSASAKGDQYLNVRVGNTVSGIDRYRSAYNKPAVVAARLSNSGRMTHKDNIASVSVNPAGTRIASVSHDKTIKLWDLESGKELRSISNIGGYANAVSWSPDGKYLINGAEDKTIRIWDAETGRAVRTITGHTDYVNEARYSPDGKRIASCADDKLVKIWDAETGKEIRTLSGHTDMIPVVAWSPDGKRIASGSDAKEKTIRLWDAETGRVLQTIPGQGGRIVALVFSPDGKKLASSTLDDKAIKIWDANTGKLLRSIPIEDNGGVYSLSWSPDGKRLASGAVYGGEDDSGNHIEIWNAETGETIRTIWENGAIYSLTWTPDGRRIIATSNFSDAQMIKVFDARTGKEL
jgi:WD40 repeat protein